MGISTTSDQSKTYSNSPRPLVWMGYGIGTSNRFHKLKLLGMVWFVVMGWKMVWKICWFGSYWPCGPASPVAPFLRKTLLSE